MSVSAKRLLAKNLFKNRGIITAFTAAAIVFTTIGIVSIISSRRFVSLAQSNKQSLENIAYLESTFSLTKDIESGVRGYVITDDLRYLESYDNASVIIRDQILAMHKSFDKDPIKSGKLKLLEQALKERIESAHETVLVAKSKGPVAGRGRILTNEGEALMNKVRFLVGILKQEERAKLKLYDAQTDEAANSIIYLITILVILEVVILMVGLVLIEVEIQKRKSLINAIEERAMEIETNYSEEDIMQLRANKVLRDVVATLRDI